MTREENMDSWASKIPQKSTLSFGDEPAEPKDERPVVAKLRSRSSASSTPKTGNERKAAQAVEVLVSLNGMFATALFVARFFDTASAIGDAEDAFREQAYAALLVDPKMCDRIIKMSSGGSSFGLMGAYGMLAMGVLPTAREEFGEFRERLEEKKRERESA